jgi:hypothetical protein
MTLNNVDNLARDDPRELLAKVTVRDLLGKRGLDGDQEWLENPTADLRGEEAIVTVANPDRRDLLCVVTYHFTSDVPVMEFLGRRQQLCHVDTQGASDRKE